MPNHVKNRITIIGTKEQVKQVFEKHNTRHEAHKRLTHDGDYICHHKTESMNYGWLSPTTNVFTRRNLEPVVGLPSDYEIEIVPPYNQFPDFNKIKPQPENIFLGNLGEKEEKECKLKGIPTWLDWNRENWGTKWNCYDCEQENENIFTFETAWSGVTKLVQEMSAQNQGIRIEYEYANEDTARNCAQFVFLDGKIISENKPEAKSKEAYELAFKLRPSLKEDYVLENGFYHSLDEFEEVEED